MKASSSQEARPWHMTSPRFLSKPTAPEPLSAISAASPLLPAPMVDRPRCRTARQATTRRTPSQAASATPAQTQAWAAFLAESVRNGLDPALITQWMTMVADATGSPVPGPFLHAPGRLRGRPPRSHPERSGNHHPCPLPLRLAPADRTRARAHPHTSDHHGAHRQRRPRLDLRWMRTLHHQEHPRHARLHLRAGHRGRHHRPQSRAHHRLAGRVPASRGRARRPPGTRPARLGRPRRARRRPGQRLLQSLPRLGRRRHPQRLHRHPHRRGLRRPSM
ncbi:hypothetical protein P3T39_007575 [Kitasatospora sp. GP82]|nr:hypothetical protein [Kitasatospora sp. GP82]